MNYITYRYKLYELNRERKFSEKSILENIAEARKKGSQEILEKLYAVLNANKANYDRNKFKLLNKYFLL